MSPSSRCTGTDEISSSQDINRFDRREIKAKIPLSEIPFVMRALGYYPTEQEVRLLIRSDLSHSESFSQVEEMINEVKFSTYIDTNTYVEDIDLNDFIRCKSLVLHSTDLTVLSSVHQSSTGLRSQSR